MNYRIVGRIVGMILLIEALFMLVPMGISFYEGETLAAQSFVATIAIMLVTGGLLALAARRGEKKFYAQEGFVATSLSWLVMSAFGALPFWISREIPNYIDALFEMVSGFTTTGASILTDVEVMSRGLLYWRSFSHWLGGMGILVFLLAVVPAAKKTAGSDMYLMRAESPGPSVGKLTPHLRQTAIILYVMYVTLTVTCTIFLLAGGMPLFDALCTAYGTAGTGGFGIYNTSMGGFSPYLQNVVMVFMFLFGINFGIYYMLIMRQFRAAFRDEELRLYCGLAVGAVVLVTLNIRSMYDSFGEALHHAAFQISSIMTTTGYSTVDFNLWPEFSKALILLLMVFGACAGSTAGGMKMSRILLLLKGARGNLRKTLHPRRVQAIQMNGRVVEDAMINSVNAYLVVYCILAFGSFVVISLDGYSIDTNLSAVLSCFNNIGPGLDMIGPMSNYSAYSNLSKLVLTLDMLLGRLEIFPVLALLSRHTWSRRR